MNTLPKSVIESSRRAGALVLALVFGSCLISRADVIGPYSPDGKTVFLFHLDDSPGTAAANAAGTLAAGTNAVAFVQAAAVTNECPLDTSILNGSAGAGGFGFGSFGTCAVITNLIAGSLTSTAGVVSNGLGVDFNLNGTFNYYNNVPAFPGDSLLNHSLIMGPNDSFTVEALINIGATNTASGTGREIVCSDSAAGTRGFQFRVNGPNLEFNFISGSGPTILAPIPSSGPNAFVGGQWYHVAIVHSDSPLTNIIYWTKLDDSITAPNLIWQTNQSSANVNAGLAVVLGNEARINGGSSEGLRGYLDEVRISRDIRGPNQFLFRNPADTAVTILRQPVGVGLDYGVPGSLYVNGDSRSDLPISYQWRKGGVPIANATNAIYTIAGAASTDAGNYDCVLTNSASGSITSAVAVVTVGQQNFLAHRYSFASDASDSIGGANGTTFGSASFNGNGQLVLNGSSGTYVGLPANVIPNNINALTIETWVTFGATAGVNSMLFAFGDTNLPANIPAANPHNYLFMTPHGATARMAITPAYSQSEQVATCPSALDGRSVHITCVFNPSAGYELLYTNGVLTASNVIVNAQISSISNAFSYIGRSLFTADPYINATYDEFRIYNGALSPASVQQSDVQGPNVTLSDTPVAFIVSPTNQTTAQGFPVTFVGVATGLPPISYQWLRGGVPIPGATNNTYSFTPVLGDNNSTYTLLATNTVNGVNYNATSATATLTVAGVITLAWVGPVNNTWDNTTANWTNGSAFANFVQFDGALFDSRGSAQPNVNVAGAIAVSSLTVSNNSNDYLLTSAAGGSLYGPAALVKDGAGRLTIDVTNTCLGATTIKNGTVQIGNHDTAGSFGGGDITNNGTVVFYRTDSLDLTNNVHGTGSLNVNGGSVVMDGTNDYTGLTTITNGVMVLHNATTLGTTNSGTVVTNTGQLYITQNFDMGFEALTLSGGATDGSGALRKGGSGVTTYNGPITLAGDTTISVDGGATLNLTNAAGLPAVTTANLALAGSGAGNITGPLNLGATAVLTNAGGTWTLGQLTNNYSGQTYLNGGTLVVGAVSGLGSAPASFTPDEISMNGGSLGASASYTLNDGLRGITVSASGGGFFVASNAVLTVVNPITGAFGGTITKSGNGMLVLSGDNSGFIGSLNIDTAQAGTVNDGITRIASPNAIANVTTIRFQNNNGAFSILQLDGSAGALNIAPAGGVTWAGRNNDVPAVENVTGDNTFAPASVSWAVGGSNYMFQSDSGTLTLSCNFPDTAPATGTRKAVFTGAGNILFNGSVNDGGDATTNFYSILKHGAGVLILAAGNNNSGTNFVDGGLMLVNGSIGTNTMTAVNGGAVGGTGTINGSTTIGFGGTLAPGNQAIGTLNINNNLALAGGNVLVLVNKSGSPANSQANVSGTISHTGAGAIIVTNMGPALQVNDTFTLFNQAVVNGGSLAVVGGGVTWNNHLAIDGTISVASTTLPQPIINSVAVNSGNLILAGVNGYTSGGFYVLSSTNLTLPLASWTRVSTNVFGSGGVFSVTNAITPGVPQSFYTVQLQQN